MRQRVKGSSMNPAIRILHQGQFLTLYRHAHWEYVERVSARGAAAMLAITPQREIVLVEQYRIPLQARTIELPAGIIGDSAEFAGESVEDSALRELLEETGYRGRSATMILSGPTAPGLTSETSNIVYVEGLERVHAGGGVDGEDITVHVVALDQVHDWLEQQRARGLRIEPRIYAALYFVLAGRLPA